MRSLRRSPPHSVFLIHAARQPMGEARRRAEAMAQVLGAERVVVKLSRPARGGAHRFSSQAHAADPRDALREDRALERWAAARRRCGLAPLEVLRSRASLDALATVCARPGLALVVIPASFAWFSSRLTALTSRLHAPVLVARRPGADDSLAVATNLEDPSRPVVLHALALAERLDVPLTIVHNAPGRGATTRDEQALAAEFGALGRPPSLTVTRKLDPAAGILEAAMRARADLIVLGVRPRTGPGIFSEHVAERVCGAADRSVLLVPV